MTKRRVVKSIAALTFIGAACSANIAFAHSGYGPGHMHGGYHGYGQGMAGPGYGHAPGMMMGRGHGYGPGMMGPGYGHGPGMMGPGYGYGPGMMGRYGQGGNSAPGPHMWGGGQPGPSAGPRGGQAQLDGLLTDLKSELKITEAQSPAWEKVTSAIRAAANNEAERIKMSWSNESRTKTLPERYEIREQSAAARLDDVKKLRSAVNDLYTALSDAQKKKANELMLPMNGMDTMRAPGPMGPGMWRR